jgi:uncharacterized protein YjeT (DUF2065 family)
VTIRYLLLVIGLVLLIEGIPYFLFPGAVKGILGYLQTLEDRTLRVFGFVLILLGVLVAALGRLGS